MKRLIAVLAVVALSLAAIPLSRAQSGGMKDMDMKEVQSEKKAQGKAHKAKGTVTKIDSAGGKVTIAHGPVQTLKWPAMTMNFVVKDKALLGKLTPEKTVEFEFVKQGSDYVITSAK